SIQALAPQPHLVFSPWVKVCLAQENAEREEICYIGKNGRTDSGSSFVAAVLIDPGREVAKILRVTLPLEVNLPEGTWIIIDQEQPISAPYIVCLKVGCVADYPASAELIERLKQGESLLVRSVNSLGQVVNFVLPLVDFGKAYNGAPSDPKAL